MWTQQKSNKFSFIIYCSEFINSRKTVQRVKWIVKWGETFSIKRLCRLANLYFSAQWLQPCILICKLLFVIFFKNKNVWFILSQHSSPKIVLLALIVLWILQTFFSFKITCVNQKNKLREDIERKGSSYISYIIIFIQISWFKLRTCDDFI